MAVVRDAAVTDPDMAAQWATNEAQRATAFRELGRRSSTQRGALNRPVDEAVDVLCALLGPEVYGVLTGRGWSPAQWERFTSESITAGAARMRSVPLTWSPCTTLPPPAGSAASSAPRCATAGWRSPLWWRRRWG